MAQQERPSYTFALTTSEEMMLEVIRWSGQRNLGKMSEEVAVFLAHVGNAQNWQADPTSRSVG